MAENDNFWGSEADIFTAEGFSASRAVAYQQKWAKRVRIEPFDGPINVIAGADVAFSRCGKHCIAAIVALRMADMEVLAVSQAVTPVQVPYIPGLLSFREAPAVLLAAAQLAVTPDVLMLDGQGLAHPRRFGLASHVGVCLGWPTVGCAKSRLMGCYREPGLNRGCRTRLLDGREVIGAVVRSRKGVKCLYVSVGHRVTLDQSVRLVLRCCRGYRLPEPTRLAHQIVTRMRNESL